MAILWSNVTDIAPSLCTVAEETQTAVLAYVNATLSATHLRSHYTMAGALLCAHYTAAMSQSSSGVSGPVVSESIGDVAQSFASYSGDGEGGLSSTGYGRAYLALIKTLPRAFVA